MKKSTHALFAIILFMLAGCNEKNESENDLITVDATKTYSPKKELILQDFMDVEYIALETNDEFVNQGFVQAIGKEIILVKNYNWGDGTIYVYSRTGKALRKINRKGQGGEEYVAPLGITLDEDRGEMYINDIFSKKIQVYDLYGNFKRSLRHKEGGGSEYYTEVFNYDNDNLICYDECNEKVPFVIISKQDGSITKEIEIPFKEKIFLRQQLNDDEGNPQLTVSPGPYSKIIPHNGNWLLYENSSDTVYTLLPDYTLRPFLVRTPSIQSMEPKIFLIQRMISERYYFMETITNTYDFKSKKGFAKGFLMYDNKEKELCGYTVYNGDYINQEEIYMNVKRPADQEIESWYPLEAHKLIESYEKGHLQGKLKEIAATLNEESNRVIMLIKHKKKE